MSHSSLKTQIEVVQGWLNAILSLTPPLIINGQIDPPTKSAIQAFQSRNGIHPTGHLTADTWRALGRNIGTDFNVRDALRNLPVNLAAHILGLPALGMSYNRSIFFAKFMAHFHDGDASQIQGLDQLLCFIEQDPDVTDHRWAAYMLTTVKTECANTWLPIAEHGCNDTTGCSTTHSGNRRLYGRPKSCPAGIVDKHGTKLTTVTTCPAGRATHAYYGRGYVQLTFAANYKTLGVALGLGEQLLHWPERALEPWLAYRIMSYGMRHGSFTGKKLSDYINAGKTDYFHARRIINGITSDNQAHAQVMAHQAHAIDAILVASTY
jgi:putative chitinase